MMGNATSSSCTPDQYGRPSTQKFCANPPSGCCVHARYTRRGGLFRRGRRPAARSPSAPCRASTPGDTRPGRRRPSHCPHGIDADATNAPENVLSSCASNTLWLARISLPPSHDFAASHSGLATRCHCPINRSRCSSNGIASALTIFCSAVCGSSPSPTAMVNSRAPSVARVRAHQVQLAHHRDVPIASPIRIPTPCACCPSDPASRRSRPRTRS